MTKNTTIEIEQQTNHEITEMLQDNGISQECMDKELEKQAKKAERLLNNKKRTQKVLSMAKTFCKVLANLPKLGEIFDDAGTLCDLISDYTMGIYEQIPKQTIIAILAGLIYCLSPIDLLPDAIPFVGIIDDGFVLTQIMRAVKNDITVYENWKQSNADIQAA